MSIYNIKNLTLRDCAESIRKIFHSNLCCAFRRASERERPEKGAIRSHFGKFVGQETYVGDQRPLSRYLTELLDEEIDRDVLGDGVVRDQHIAPRFAAI